MRPKYLTNSYRSKIRLLRNFKSKTWWSRTAFVSKRTDRKLLNLTYTRKNEERLKNKKLIGTSKSRLGSSKCTCLKISTTKTLEMTSNNKLQSKAIHVRAFLMFTNRNLEDSESLPQRRISKTRSWRGFVSKRSLTPNETSFTRQKANKSMSAS